MYSTATATATVASVASASVSASCMVFWTLGSRRVVVEVVEAVEAVEVVEVVEAAEAVGRSKLVGIVHRYFCGIAQRHILAAKSAQKVLMGMLDERTLLIHGTSLM
jgi:hypothetical protein